MIDTAFELVAGKSCHTEYGKDWRHMKRKEMSLHFVLPSATTRTQRPFQKNLSSDFDVRG